MQSRNGEEGGDLTPSATSSPSTRLRLRSPEHAVIWITGFAIALALYSATAHRGVQWQDAGWQQCRIITGQLDHPRGLALVHPVHYYLGRLAIRLPAIGPALGITLLSSFAGAIAVANVALTLSLLVRNRWAVIVGAAGLMMAHTFWQHATHTESYALTAALLTTEWLLLAVFAVTGRSGCLPLLALTNGLGIATHLLAVLALPMDIVIMVWAVRRRRCTLRLALGAAALWLLGTLPYSELVLAMYLETGSLTETLHSALLGSYASNVLNTRLTLHNVLLSVGYVAYNFPGLTIPLALLGARAALSGRLFPHWVGRVLLGELLIFTLFVARYPIVDQYTFFFPIYMILALLAGIGLAAVLERASDRRRNYMVGAAALTVAWTPIVFLGTSYTLAASGSLRSLVGNKPYRDGYRAFFLPWGVGDNAAQQLNAALSELSGPDSVIVIGDSMIAHGIRYAQVVGQLPSTVQLVTLAALPSHESIDALHVLLTDASRAGRTVLFVPRDRDLPNAPVDGADWERLGDVYRLVRLAAPPVDMHDDRER